ncbi:MAG TPA: WcaF family extracellular polysaccharide biosynthesis acetyltransferase [Bryobacteraceae bacterium]|nr:WcaF family extracellular polysaccharide biosynthesis acetyltransferase [Bryobacteraceae bacterium]
MSAVDLSAFHNEWYRPGRSRLVQAAWFFLGSPLVRFPLLPLSGARLAVLRLFGARIGRGVVIKPGVRVKYPWLLTTGDHCWIGEDCWIDNLAEVTLGSDVCISQGAYLCCGNHDWSDPAFGLLVGKISVADGAWIGARAVVGPGSIVGECAVVTAGSVVTRRVPAFEIHGGNPAVFLRNRQIRKANRAAEAVHSEVL